MKHTQLNKKIHSILWNTVPLYPTEQENLLFVKQSTYLRKSDKQLRLYIQGQYV